MVSELGGEGAMPPQLPTPARGLLKIVELRDRLYQQIHRGSLLRRGVAKLKVFLYFNPSVVAIESVNHQRWLRFFSSIASSSSWSRSAKCSSKVLVNRTSRSRFVKVSSAELVVVVSSPQRRTSKKKVNPLFLASFQNRSVECTSTALFNQPKVVHSLCFLLSLCNGQSSRPGKQPVDSDFACIDCKRVLSEQQIAAEPVKEEPENPPVKSIKSKKTKESKAKKSSAPRKRNPLAHTPNFEMVQEAIVTLKEMTGSCQYAIQKFIAKKQKTLLSNFRKLLLFHLKKFVAVDKFVNVKNSAVSLVLTMMFYGFKEIFTYTLSSFFLKLKSLVKMHLLILDCLSILILFKVIGNSVALNSSYGSAEEVACDSDSVSSGSDSFLTRGLVMVFGYECVHIQKITEASGTEEAEIESETSKIAVLLRRFLQRRAQAYARLKMGFEDYMVSGVESTYQKLCSKIAVEFNDCSKQVLEMESQILSPDCFREDLVVLLRFVQTQECKLNLTDTI